MSQALRTFRIQTISLYTALAAFTLIGIGWVVVAGFVPPIAPGAPAHEVATLYSDSPDRVRFGLLILMLASPFQLLLFAVISHHLKRIEGASSLLSQLQMAFAVMGVFPIYISSIAWSVAAFRTDRPAELILLLNDYGWFWALMAAPGGVGQLLIIATGTLLDKSAPAILPRWYGYICAWTALSFLLAMSITFFKTGPFAWNGLFSFWLGLVAFGAWLTSSFFVAFRATRHEFENGSAS